MARIDEPHAIRWIAPAPAAMAVAPYELLIRNARNHRKLHREFREERRADPSKTFAPPVAMEPVLHGEEYPLNCGLVTMCITGNVPVHSDPSYAEYSYLLLLRPGPYMVIDSRLDMETPQPAGSILCFRDHSQHGLVHNRHHKQSDWSFVMEAQNNGGYRYDHIPAQSWSALAFDHPEELSPEAADAEMERRIRKAFASLLERRAA